jgi:predicted Zn-ribbon and HTH transcriptional regulator
MSDTEDVEAVAPYTCQSCGYVFYVPLEPGKNKCPRCGTCVECV